MRPYNNDVKEAAIKLRSSGMSLQTVCNRLEVSLTTVARWTNHLHIIATHPLYRTTEIVKHCVLSAMKRNPNYSQIVFQGKNADQFANYIFQDDKLVLLPRKHRPPPFKKSDNFCDS